MPLVLTAGTDNRANEFLSNKRSTTRWPLMAANMQLSLALASARISVRLQWRPRGENQDTADFDLKKRVNVSFCDVDLNLLGSLHSTWLQFETSREEAKVVRGSANKKVRKKNRDKTDW